VSEVKQIPEALAQALAHTAVDIKPLNKGDENKFQNYKYVSIDDYYLQVPQHALNHGLTWTLREVETKTFRLEGKKGPETAMAFTYEVDLVHVDGHYVQGYDRITIYHPAQGAQTAGSARSYADKLFMRTAFKIATGEHELREPDADATDNRRMGPDVSVFDDFDTTPAQTPPPNEEALDLPPATEEIPEQEEQDPAEAIIEQEVKGIGPKFKNPVGNDDAVLIEQVFRQFMPVHKTKQSLRAFWGQNKEALGVMEGLDKELYEALRKDITELGKSLPDEKEKGK